MFLKVAWAPGKAIKGSDFKQFWDEDRGVTYVPWDRMKGKSIRDLSDGSVVDPDSIPPGMTLEGNRFSLLLLLMLLLSGKTIYFFGIYPRKKLFCCTFSMSTNSGAVV